MRKSLLHVSPLLLGAACALLTAIIGVFAVANYQREKALMQETLLRQADVVVRIVNSSVRNSFIKSFRDSGEVSQVQESFQFAVEQAKEQDGVESIFIVSNEGQIIAGAAEEKISFKLQKDDLRFIKKIINEQSQTIRISKSPKHKDAELFKFGVQLTSQSLAAPVPMMRPEHMMMDHRNKRPNSRFQRLANKLEGELGTEGLVLLVNLDLNKFNTALKQQLQQLVVLSVILLLVGIGGWLSLLTLQGLRGSQSRLAKMRAFTDRLVSSIPIGIIGVGQDGFVRVVNEETLKILHKSNSQLMSHHFNESLIDLKEHTDLSLVEDRKHEFIYADPSGGKKTIQLYAVNIHDEKGLDDGFVVLLQDLTDQRLLEEELQRSARLASLGKVAAGVAHELRNPLSSIKGLGTLLQNRFSEGSPDRQTADVLVAEIERLNRSIGELLDYAKPQKADFSLISLQDSIEKAVSLVEYDAEDLGIDISFNLPENHLIINGNIDKLNQVFLNLLLNSIQAIDRSAGEIIISSTVTESYVEVEVVDNGTGIDEQSFKKVFDPYFTTKADGTGLGLSICTKIVEEHGGEIKIESQAGEGCKTIVKLPLAGSTENKSTCVS